MLDTTINYDTLKATAIKQDKKLLKEVNLFDVYEGKNLPKGKKSYGLSFKFLNENKTLTDVEVDKIMTKIINALTKEYDAQLR